MNASNKPFFGRLIAKLALNLGREISDDLIDVFFKSLEHYEIDDIKQAAIKINATFKKFPVVADFHELLADKSAQHVGEDEAWAIAVRMFNENETVIVTDEITAAWGIAEPVYSLGDKIGARMAFKDAYSRADKSAAPVWRVLPGYDKALRHQRVSDAVIMGRLPESALEQFPALENANPAALVAGFIGYVPKAEDKEKAKEALGNLRAMLKAKSAGERIFQYEPISTMVSDIPAHQRTDGFASMHRRIERAEDLDAIW